MWILEVEKNIACASIFYFRWNAAWGVQIKIILSLCKNSFWGTIWVCFDRSATEFLITFFRENTTMYEIILEFYMLYALYMWMLEVEENIGYASILYFRWTTAWGVQIKFILSRCKNSFWGTIWVCFDRSANEFHYNFLRLYT